MLKVYAAEYPAGSLFKPESEPEKYHFRYDGQCPPQAALSLTMPVTLAHYSSAGRVLHPVFDMNLPEGALADRLRRQFGKVIPNFDALALLKIVGKSQIGRLRFAMPGEDIADIPTQSVQSLLAHDGAEGLFESLLSRYAVHSGLSGAMPKVMLRDEAQATQATPAPGRLSYRGATHIVKAWTDEFPRLAENEYFCMRAALHANLEVPGFELSSGGKFLVLNRFDLENNSHLGFEDFCVLNGKTASQKYDGSYENIAKRIKAFVSPRQLQPALESFFKALALSCALKNGDAHLKNFGVLYNDTQSSVRLAPIYDLVTTTVYLPTDVLALTLGGTKRWPSAKALLGFARAHCNLTDIRARRLLEKVAQGVLQAADEAALHMQSHALFQTVGSLMLAQWKAGLALSVHPELRS